MLEPRGMIRGLGSKIQALSSHPPSGLFYLYIQILVFKQLKPVECHCAPDKLEDWGILVWRWMLEPRGMIRGVAPRFNPSALIPPVAFLVYIWNKMYLSSSGQWNATVLQTSLRIEEFWFDWRILEPRGMIRGVAPRFKLSALIPPVASFINITNDLILSS